MGSNINTISILGCGWLGLPLAKFLITKGFKVNGSTSTDEKLILLKEEGITPFKIKIDDQGIEGDISGFLQSEILVINIPPKRRPDIVEYYSRQFDLLIGQIKKSLVRKVVFASTTSVYQNNNGVVNEHTHPQPEKPSGIATLDIEKRLRSSSSFQTTIVRFAGLTGPDRHPGRFLAGKTNLLGANDPVNLIHLDDCIGIIHQIIEREAWGEVFNGCAEEHPAKKEFYTKAALQLGLTPPAFSDNPSSGFKIVDGSKIKSSLHYQYQFPDPLKLVD